MSASEDFLSFALERMSFVDGLRVLARFGGHALYCGHDVFAIISGDRLFLKTDATSRAEFEARGLEKFKYVIRGQITVMRYYEAPPEVFGDQDTMRIWVDKAIVAAVGNKRPRSYAEVLERLARKPDRSE